MRFRRIADKEGVARRRGYTAQHLVGVAVVGKAHPRFVVEGKHTVGRHSPRSALQGRSHHLEGVGIVIVAESVGKIENIEVGIAVIEGGEAFACRLPAVGEGIVEGHILGEVNPQVGTPRFNLLEERADIVLAVVAVVVVEHQRGDVVFALGVVVEQVLAAAGEGVAAFDVVEQAVAVGNIARALQQAGLQQAGDNQLDVGVRRLKVGGAFLDLLHDGKGFGVPRRLEIGECLVVQCTQHAVVVYGQRVGNIGQSRIGKGDAKLRVAVAVEERLLVNAVHTRAAQGVHLVVMGAGGGQNQGRQQI